MEKNKSINVTPEMIQAGVDAYCGEPAAPVDHESGEPEKIVEKIFKAMVAKIAPRSDGEAS